MAAPQSFSMSLRLPKRIVAFDAQGKPQHFRLTIDWFGGLHITQQSALSAFAPGERCWLILDPALVFYRKSRLPVQSAADLPRLAADFFPFPPEQTFYAQARIDNEDYVCALRDQDWQQWQKTSPAPPAGVLVTPVNIPSVRAAIQNRLARGAIADLQPRPDNYFQPGVARAIFWAMLLFVLLAGGVWGGQRVLAWQNSRLEARLNELSAEFGQVRAQGKALQKMQETLLTLADFQGGTGTALYNRLQSLVQTLPPNHSIDRIEYKDGRLSIGGLGQSPQSWLLQNGALANDVQITQLPQINRYTATIPIASPPTQ